MGLRPGYKQTEVGVIPEDWQVSTLGARGRFSKGSGVKKDQANSGSLACIRYGEIYTHHHEIIGQPTSFISKEVACSARRLTCGDILFAGSGETKEEIGKCAAFVDEIEAYAGGDIIIYSPRSDDSRFLGYALNQPLTVRQKAANAQGDAVVHINQRALAKVSLPFPPLPEQREIAGALSDVDAALAGLRRLVAKKRDLKQAAMQQLLTGQTRLPGFDFANGRIKVSDIGPIPEDWEISSLRDLTDPARGIRYGIVQPGKCDPTGRFMIRGQDYSESKGWADPDQVFRVGPEIERRYQNARVRSGDLIMTIVGYCGHVEVVPPWLDGANLTQTTARLAIRVDRANAGFCKAVLNGPVGRQQVASFLKGAAQPGLNCGDVEKFKLPVPSLAEQAAIANILSGMDAEIEALEAQREKMRMLKQAMMQALLTGHVRLPIPQDVIAVAMPAGAHG